MRWPGTLSLKDSVEEKLVCAGLSLSTLVDECSALFQREDRSVVLITLLYTYTLGTTQHTDNDSAT